MNHSPADSSPIADVRMTRMTPSAPIPRRRSQRAATKAPSSWPWMVPSWSGRSTKSFSVPCPLSHGNVIEFILRAPASKDRHDGAVDVGLRRGVVGHRDAHEPAPAPRGAPHPARPVALDAVDDGVRRLVIAEADQHLVE